ncbi:MFS transporter [Lentzea nigeriaca]|uniref:MFS transporter n=1 Tax=Lentzea nigeriaca TaxID=1128665 RepID=UPI00195C887E|nr:MFS transporter [Lentzea nigeriaca]MBM7857142.1 MFS family permease [Lentzea nigeriaca]
MQETVAAAHRRLALSALLTAEAMNLVDATIVQVAAPAMHADLGGRASDIQWFSAAYTLPFAVLLITGGRLGDIWGRKRVFTAGVTGFALASVACSLAWSAGVLITFRAVQGAAAALIIPQVIGLIRALFAGPELSRALGTIGPVMGLSAVLGPVLGGVLTHADLFGSSWRSVFLVNVPLSVLVLTIAPKLAEDRAPRRPGLDPAGTLLAAIGIGLIIYPLVESIHLTAWGWLSVAAGAVVCVVFAVHQRVSAARGRTSLVEVSLFTRRVFPAALLTSTLFFCVTTGVSLVVVLQRQLGEGGDALAAGLTLLPWSIGLAVSSWIAGAHLVPRYGIRVMFAGLVAVLAGLLGAVEGPVPRLVALLVVGSGVGLFTSSFFTAALNVVRPQEVGSAAGLLNAVQQLGGTLGVALLGSVYLGSGAGAAFWTAATLVVACFATGALIPGTSLPR